MKHMARVSPEGYSNISQLMQVSDFIFLKPYPGPGDIPGYASLSNLSQVILGYPIAENVYWDIPGYPDFSRPGARVLRCQCRFSR